MTLERLMQKNSPLNIRDEIDIEVEGVVEEQLRYFKKRRIHVMDAYTAINGKFPRHHHSAINWELIREILEDFYREINMLPPKRRF